MPSSRNIYITFVIPRFNNFVWPFLTKCGAPDPKENDMLKQFSDCQLIICPPCVCSKLIPPLIPLYNLQHNFEAVKERLDVMCKVTGMEIAEKYLTSSVTVLINLVWRIER